MSVKRGKVEDAEKPEEIRPGEVGSTCVRLLGGKEAYCKLIVHAYHAAPEGGMAKSRILEMIQKDLERGNEANARSLEDLDDEALDEIAFNTEKLIADQRAAAAEEESPAGAQIPAAAAAPAAAVGT